MKSLIGKLNGGLIIIPFLYMAFSGLSTPLWWDEINSFVYYSLWDTTHTLTSLKTANNHIFFNYVMNVYSEKIHSRTISDIIVAPHKFRSITFISSLLTVFFTYKTGQRIGGRNVAMIAAVTLTTTIPYLNYCLQLRGYGFSMLFLASALYFIFSYEEKGNIVYAFMIPISIFLLLLTLISNIYVTLCIVLVVFLQLLLNHLSNKKNAEPRELTTEESLQNKTKRKAKKKNTKQAIKNTKPPRYPYLKTLFLIGLGVAIALLRYLPARQDFSDLNKVLLSALPPYRSYVIAELLPALFVHFISFRYLIFLILGIVAWLSVSKEKRNKYRKTFTFIVYFLILFLVPFFISFLNNNYPFDRTFIVLIPAFCLVVALSTDLVISNFSFLNAWKERVATLIILYSLGTFFIANDHIQSRLANDIKSGQKEQNLTYNYYLSNLFQPVHQMTDFVNSQATDHSLPLISFEDVDMIALSTASNLKNISYFKLNWEKAIDTSNIEGKTIVNNIADYWESTKENTSGYKTWQLQFKSSLKDKNMGKKILIQYLKEKNKMTNKFYAVTGFPDKFKEELKAIFPTATVKALYKKESYNNFFEVTLN